jgi:hemoglobin
MEVMTNSAQSARAALGPGAALGVDEAMIRAVVHGFYSKVRVDAVLGPIFARVADDAWDAHLSKLCDFWSSVLLATRRYDGRPMPAHVAIPEIAPPHFARWLELFRATAREVCPPEAAGLFIARAEMIAQSLQLGIAASRGELPPLHA